jgi:hypothetical protein
LAAGNERELVIRNGNEVGTSRSILLLISRTPEVRSKEVREKGIPKTRRRLSPFAKYFLFQNSRKRQLSTISFPDVDGLFNIVD